MLRAKTTTFIRIIIILEKSTPREKRQKINKKTNRKTIIVKEVALARNEQKA